MPLNLPLPLLLAPLPFVLYALRRRGGRFLLVLTAFWVYLLALVVGLSTESAQLLVMLLIRSNYRSVDINDTLFNALGVMLGYGVLWLGLWSFGRIKRRFPALSDVTFPVPSRYTLQMNPAAPQTFAALYRQYLPAVYRYLYRRVGSAAEAEDLTAQTFTEAFDAVRRNSFRPETNFPAFLFTIARRRAADFYRHRPEAPLTEHPDPEPGLLSAIEAREDIRRLRTLLAQLDEEKQELLRLRFSAGLGFAEIALLEGKSEAAVKMTLYRALAWLRDHWEADHA